MSKPDPDDPIRLLTTDIQILKWYLMGNSCRDVANILFKQRFPGHASKSQSNVNRLHAKLEKNGCLWPSNSRIHKIKKFSGPDGDKIEIEEMELMKEAVQFVKWYYSGRSVQHIVFLHKQAFGHRPMVSEHRIRTALYLFEHKGCVNGAHEIGSVLEEDADKIPDCATMERIKKRVKSEPPAVPVPTANGDDYGDLKRVRMQ